MNANLFMILALIFSFNTFADSKLKKEVPLIPKERNGQLWLGVGRWDITNMVIEGQKLSEDPGEKDDNDYFLGLGYEWREAYLVGSTSLLKARYDDQYDQNDFIRQYSTEFSQSLNFNLVAGGIEFQPFLRGSLGHTWIKARGTDEILDFTSNPPKVIRTNAYEQEVSAYYTLLGTGINFKFPGSLMLSISYAKFRFTPYAYKESTQGQSTNGKIINTHADGSLIQFGLGIRF